MYSTVYVPQRTLYIRLYTLNLMQSYAVSADAWHGSITKLQQLVQINGRVEAAKKTKRTAKKLPNKTKVTETQYLQML